MQYDKRKIFWMILFVLLWGLPLMAPFFALFMFGLSNHTDYPLISFITLLSPIFYVVGTIVFINKIERNWKYTPLRYAIAALTAWGAAALIVTGHSFGDINIKDPSDFAGYVLIFCLWYPAVTRAKPEVNILQTVLSYLPLCIVLITKNFVLYVAFYVYFVSTMLPILF